MIEKSQVNTQTNKKGKEHSKISKCAGQEKKFCVSKIKKECVWKMLTQSRRLMKEKKDTINNPFCFCNE